MELKEGTGKKYHQFRFTVLVLTVRIGLWERS